MQSRIIGPEPDRDAIAAMTELDHIRARVTRTGPRGYMWFEDADTLRGDRRRLLEMLDEAHETIRALRAEIDETHETWRALVDRERAARAAAREREDGA